MRQRRAYYTGTPSKPRPTTSISVKRQTHILNREEVDVLDAEATASHESAVVVDGCGTFAFRAPGPRDRQPSRSDLRELTTCNDSCLPSTPTTSRTTPYGRLASASSSSTTLASLEWADSRRRFPRLTRSAWGCSPCLNASLPALNPFIDAFYQFVCQSIRCCLFQAHLAFLSRSSYILSKPYLEFVLALVV